MLVLYFSPGSSSMAAHIALHEVDATFEPRPLSFARKEQRDPAYLALNAEGKVPTLLVDGHALTEVAGILLYLARRFPDAALLPPDDPMAEAQAVSWMSFIASSLHWGQRGGLDNARVAFALAERRLGGRDWALGTYSIADIHLFRLFWRFRRSLPAAADEFPALGTHYERMMARPAVQKTCAIEAAIGYELPDQFRPRPA